MIGSHLYNSQMIRTWNDCATELNAAGYRHTHADRYAKLPARRSGKLTWARIAVDDTGNHSIEYLKGK